MSSFNFFVSTYGLPLTIGFVFLLIWSLIWKGLALWKAARQSDKWWFMVMLVVNTVGILEILYIYVFSKKKLL
ncbi:MAG: DUF5652 family protein [Candidatus Azambacteria bacterium]|nr:DUF5652 family protein [Candidatus Azambacteria bacterium]